jgi:cyclohexyl-isocyanide hydratase
VDDGDIVTAGGVSCAIDAGLHVVERLAGPEARARVASQMDYPYRWDPLPSRNAIPFGK